MSLDITSYTSSLPALSLTRHALYWIKVLWCLHTPRLHPVQNSTFLLMLCFLILPIMLPLSSPPITLFFSLFLCPLLNKSPLLFHSYIWSYSHIVAVCRHCGSGGLLKSIRGIISAPLRCDTATPKANVPRQFGIIRHGKYRCQHRFENGVIMFLKYNWDFEGLIHVYMYLQCK